MKFFLPLFLLSVSLLRAERVDFVSSFTFDEIVPRRQLAKDTQFQVRYFRQTFDVYFNSLYQPDIAKIFITADIGNGSALSQVPLEKRMLLLFEPPGGYLGHFEEVFSRIYTFNDDVVDGKKYFKFFFPTLIPMISDLPSFENKKFCVLMTHRCTGDRAQLVRFFETKPFEEFECYGFNPIIKTDRYRGQIPGHPVGHEKLEILKNFRFCICFENDLLNGYISEKIFSAFAAGCVPVYLGAMNIDEYVPSDCFIDYRDFTTDEELYQFLKSISKEQYQQYICNIASFLKSEKAHLFSQKHFGEIVFECVRGN